MPTLRIAAAQVPSVRGDLAANLATHRAAIRAAAVHGVDFLAFAELSLVGYEPDLAATHALAPDDARLDELTALAVAHRMHVMAGAPLWLAPAGAGSAAGGWARMPVGKPALGAVVFGPDGARTPYAKMHLGGVEARHFAPGATPVALAVGDQTLGLSICADSSVPAHPATYAAAGAGVYVASMFLDAEWDATDRPRLARYAAAHDFLVLLANHGASRGTYRSVGRSAVWEPGGALLAEAPGTDAAVVIATRDAERWTAAVIAL